MKKGDLRRGQILDKAEELFFERGYDRTSIQDILTALNLSKGGFYHYFDAKETVLRELCERKWALRLEKVKAELRDGRRSPVDRLDLLLGLANLFDLEDRHFSAMMLKICYQDDDASVRDHRRCTLIELIEPLMDDVIQEGIEAGSLHSRMPAQLGRLLLLLACDINDEVCRLLASDVENPDRMLRMLELLNAYRESVETLSGAPYGSLRLFDASKLVNAWQAALEELSELEAKAL